VDVVRGAERGKMLMKRDAPAPRPSASVPSRSRMFGAARPTPTRTANGQDHEFDAVISSSDRITRGISSGLTPDKPSSVPNVRSSSAARTPTNGRKPFSLSAARRPEGKPEGGPEAAGPMTYIEQLRAREGRGSRDNEPPSLRSRPFEESPRAEKRAESPQSATRRPLYESATGTTGTRGSRVGSSSRNSRDRVPNDDEQRSGSQVRAAIAALDAAAALAASERDMTKGFKSSGAGTRLRPQGDDRPASSANPKRATAPRSKSALPDRPDRPRVSDALVGGSSSSQRGARSSFGSSPSSTPRAGFQLAGRSGSANRRDTRPLSIPKSASLSDSRSRDRLPISTIAHCAYAAVGPRLLEEDQYWSGVLPRTRVAHGPSRLRPAG